MAAKEPTFEENLAQLTQIVTDLEQGDVPLEAALAEFQKGVKLSQKLQGTLSKAETTLAKMMDDQGQVQPFETDDKAGADHGN